MAANAPSDSACPSCKGFGVLETPEGRVVRCACRAAVLAEVRMRAAQIPERYLNCRIENFDLKRAGSSASHAKASRAARKFVDEWKVRDRGLLFVGPVGVGKTHLAVAILKTLIEDCGVRGVFCDFTDLTDRIQATFSRTNSDSADDVLAPYRDAELLVLDELGARRPTDWGRDVLYGLINTRYNRRRLTVVTSNYSDEPGRPDDENLEKRIGAMVRSRLYEMCDLVVLDGKDYREWRSVKV
jgi:DNA replication protein DnaC